MKAIIVESCLTCDNFECEYKKDIDRTDYDIPNDCPLPAYVPREEALEEAAKVCEEQAEDTQSYSAMLNLNHVAEAIRKLK